jgi:hypothetical protein
VPGESALFDQFAAVVTLDKNKRVEEWCEPEQIHVCAEEEKKNSSFHQYRKKKIFFGRATTMTLLRNERV